MEGSGGGWSEKRNEKGGVMQELKIQAPVLTEEDQHGYTMPPRYKCDSCRAVMFHLDQDLRMKQPKGRRLKEWEYTDIIDETCRSSFKDYGVKLIDGENVLSGPGVKHESVEPGAGAIQMGGESWNKRLGEVCRKTIYERLGEEEFYDRFYGAFTADEQGPDGRPAIESMCTRELGDCMTGPMPPPKPADEEPAAKAAAKPKKSKAAKKATRGSSAASSSAADVPSGGGGIMDAEAFLRSLATKHGMADDEYVLGRTERDWERLMVTIAGRVFSRVSDSCAGSSASCPSGG